LWLLPQVLEKLLLRGKLVGKLFVWLVVWLFTTFGAGARRRPEVVKLLVELVGGGAGGAGESRRVREAVDDAVRDANTGHHAGKGLFDIDKFEDKLNIAPARAPHCTLHLLVQIFLGLVVVVDVVVVVNVVLVVELVLVLVLVVEDELVVLVLVEVVVLVLVVVVVPVLVVVVVVLVRVVLVLVVLVCVVDVTLVVDELIVVAFTSKTVVVEVVCMYATGTKFWRVLPNRLISWRICVVPSTPSITEQSPFGRIIASVSVAKLAYSMQGDL